MKCNDTSSSELREKKLRAEGKSHNGSIYVNFTTSRGGSRNYPFIILLLVMNWFGGLVHWCIYYSIVVV